jgi:hypothetical protein
MIKTISSFRKMKFTKANGTITFYTLRFEVEEEDLNWECMGMIWVQIIRENYNSKRRKIVWDPNH